jgi:hypothetical protein
MPFDREPPTSLPPDISLTLAGFQIFAPGGGVKAVPYFQVFMSNGPWFTAPGGATSRALLSTPAGAAIGNWIFCCALAAAPDIAASAHAADIPTKCLLIVPSVDLLVSTGSQK